MSRMINSIRIPDGVEFDGRNATIWLRPEYPNIREKVVVCTVNSNTFEANGNICLDGGTPVIIVGRNSSKWFVCVTPRGLIAIGKYYLKFEEV